MKRPVHPCGFKGALVSFSKLQDERLADTLQYRGGKEAVRAQSSLLWNNRFFLYLPVVVIHGHGYFHRDSTTQCAIHGETTSNYFIRIPRATERQRRIAQWAMTTIAMKKGD